MKKILIIGATSAIASACARHWASERASMFLIARNQGRLGEMADDLAIRGATDIHWRQMDSADFAAHQPAIDAALEVLGFIDIALIAYGTLPDQRACEADASLAAREFSVNATSTIALLTALARVFERQRSGALGVITSVAGDRGRPSNYLYGSAKAAVSIFCEGLRARLYKVGVSLTDIRPGFVATPMTAALNLPGALVASPEAVAGSIVAGISRGADVLYAPRFWSLIMFVIRGIPGSIFKRLNL